MITLYVTPNKEYKVIKLETSKCASDWDEVFGNKGDSYFILKRTKSEESEYRYEVYRYEETSTSCYLWLRNNSIISKDEYNSLLGNEKNEKQEEH